MRASALFSEIFFVVIIGAAVSMTGSGCGILLGNVKPVAEKSQRYRILDLTASDADWKRIPTSEQEPGKSAEDPSSASELSDIAYQASSTSSIISLNSACRESWEHTDQDLREFSRLLFLGITDVDLRTEKELVVQETPALETTVRGKLSGEPTMLRTVVLKRNRCVYDLMYVARPENFDKQENTFSKFVASLHLE